MTKQIPCQGVSCGHPLLGAALFALCTGPAWRGQTVRHLFSLCKVFEKGPGGGEPAPATRAKDCHTADRTERTEDANRLRPGSLTAMFARARRSAPRRSMETEENLGLDIVVKKGRVTSSPTCPPADAEVSATGRLEVCASSSVCPAESAHPNEASSRLRPSFASGRCLKELALGGACIPRGSRAWLRHAEHLKQRTRGTRLPCDPCR